MIYSQDRTVNYIRTVIQQNELDFSAIPYNVRWRQGNS